MIAHAAIILMQQSPATRPAPDVLREAAVTVIFYLMIILVVFVVGTIAILRASRRFRESLNIKKKTATPSSDVWVMHKVPEMQDDEDPESGQDFEQEGRGNDDK